MTVRYLSEVRAGTALSTSVAIVGAGPAGITLALELAARSVDVILLEAGDVALDEESQERYAGPLTVGEGFAYPPLDAWRLRMFGGTSNHWGGWCRRLEANVFEPRPWLGDVGWPFPIEELELSYPPAHERCELGRDVYDAGVIQRDLGLRPWEGLERHGLETSIWRYSPPTLFAERYRGDLERGAVDVLLRAEVVSVDGTGSTVRSLEVRADDGERRTVTADVVVIATGGLESVRQLLHLRAAGHLAVDWSDWLGLGFMEHPHGVVGAVVIDGELATDPTGPLAIFTSRLPDVDGVDVRAGLTLSADMCADREVPNMSFTIDPGPAADDLVRQLPHGDGVTELVELVTSRRAVAHRVFLRSEQRHEPASRISLTDERDGLGLARLALDWRVAPQDVQAVSIGMELVVDAFADLGVAVVHHDPVVPAPTGLTGGAHHLGGARMHDDPRQGVVDADLRVHGTDNLFVCSSSTFPTGCHSNPTMTVVALAHRLAQRLAAA